MRDLMPALMKTILDSGEPQQALHHMAEFGRRIGARTGFLTLLAANPKTTRLLIDLYLVWIREPAFPELPDDPFLLFQVLPDLRLRLVPVSGDLFPGAEEKPVESRVYHSGMLAVVLPEGSGFTAGFTAIVQPARQGALAVRALGISWDCSWANIWILCSTSRRNR